jgi:hypothetical protein
MEEYSTLPNMFDRMMSNVPDPIHAMMVKRKNCQEIPPMLIQSNEDIAQLEEFCNQHGIMGFSCGNMNPKLALRLLKSKMGVVDTENYNKCTDRKMLLD